MSLRPTEVSYILSGGGYEVKDVEAISAAAEAACEDTKLMELAWEVRELYHALRAFQCDTEISLSSVNVLHPTRHLKCYTPSKALSGRSQVQGSWQVIF